MNGEIGVLGMSRLQAYLVHAAPDNRATVKQDSFAELWQLKEI